MGTMEMNEFKRFPKSVGDIEQMERGRRVINLAEAIRSEAMDIRCKGQHLKDVDVLCDRLADVLKDLKKISRS